jgi:hypothetical protein
VICWLRFLHLEKFSSREKMGPPCLLSDQLAQIPALSSLGPSGMNLELLPVMKNRKLLLPSLVIPAILAAATPAWAASAPTPAFLNFHSAYGLRGPTVSPEKPEASKPGSGPESEAAQERAAPAAPRSPSAPAVSVRPKPAAAFVEEAPEAASEEANGAAAKTPKFVRINIDNYHIRTTPEFDVSNVNNVAGKSSKNAIYAVTRIQKMQTGTAVGIWLNGKEHWIFMPSWRKDQFSFCESEACFADLAAVLKILSRQGVTNQALAECGISLDNRGNPLVAELPAKPDQVALPPARNAAELNRMDRRVQDTRQQAPPAREISVELPWEKAKGTTGRQWTKWVLQSLEKYGKNLQNTRSLGDAAAYCPNYARLTPSQRTEMWAYLIASIAIPESRFKTNGTFDESTHRNRYSGVVNPRTFSQGLLALSYSSTAQRAYRPFCNFNYSADRGKDISDPSLQIYDVQKQLDCGVGMLDFWVKKHGRIGGSPPRGGAMFWSTLRETNPATRLVKASMRRFKPCFGGK